MQRIVFKFSIRHDAIMTIEEMVTRVGPALGCQLQEGGWFQRIAPAWEGYLLGMKIQLYEWGGVDDTPIFRLDGMIDDASFAYGPDGQLVSFVDQDLSAGLIDLLCVKGAGDWRIPSAEDLRWEQAYGGALDRHMNKAFDEDDEDPDESLEHEK